MSDSVGYDRRQFVNYFASIGLGSTLLPGVLWAKLEDGAEISSARRRHARHIRHRYACKRQHFVQSRHLRLHLDGLAVRLDEEGEAIRAQDECVVQRRSRCHAMWRRGHTDSH